MPQDHAISFFDTSWLAVKCADADPIIDILALSDTRPTTWAQGLDAVCGDYWDFDADPGSELSRVFITPRIGNWRLAVGGWLGTAGESGATAIHTVADYCKTLSTRYHQAHAYTTQGRMDWYSWILARDGNIDRAFAWSDKVIVDEGSPSSAEAASRGKVDRWRPSEQIVMAIAAESSKSPRDFGPHTLCTGDGALATTEWGRKHGIPNRPLIDAT